ncbi:uncharacterized protein A4U43_C08F28340 [Asparagus officinalis]|nr:uncharacterized protein A4U43_C08F28340 [Asparagus officinalis]
MVSWIAYHNCCVRKRKGDWIRNDEEGDVEEQQGRALEAAGHRHHRQRKSDAQHSQPLAPKESWRLFKGRD